MPSPVRFPAASLGLLIGLCGCYHHYGYSPYGSAPYGPSYPVAPMSPSDPYVPYNGSPGVSPTPISPGGSPTPNWQPGTQPLPGNPNPARPYEPNNGSKGLVPNPTDDEKEFGNRPGAGVMPANPAGIDPGPIPAGQPATPAATASSGDPFDSSLRPVSSGSNVTARTPSDSPSSRPNPFAHDARNFAWLRGIVDFDPQDQRWIMVYSANPDAADRYGGSITLGDHALLSKIKPGDVVLVEGAVDLASLDQHGKPLYRVDKLQPLKPKQ